MVLCHTVHLPRGALLSPCTVCGTGGYTYYHIWQVSWFLDAIGSSTSADRIREGDAARWDGTRPVSVGTVTCAEQVIFSQTEVNLQGGCGTASGIASLPNDMLRAELGIPFVLQVTYL